MEILTGNYKFTLKQLQAISNKMAIGNCMCPGPDTTINDRIKKIKNAEVECTILSSEHTFI